VIDVITVSTDSYTDVLYPGDTLFLNDTNFPMDTIAIGFTKLGFNNTHMGFNIVENQLRDGLFHIEKKDWANIVLAYEPVWAIGTGETASPEQAQEMHKFIRTLVEKVYGFDIADTLTILYGGSVKPDNAKEIFSKPDVDGGLIGGAALKADDFLAIVNGF
jgi:triosephosphate isomerase